MSQDVVIGSEWKHKHMDATAKILQKTSKGYRTEFVKNGKTKIQFFHNIDFDSEKGLFERLEKCDHECDNKMNSHLDEFEYESDERVNATPAIVSQTIETGNDLVNKDYLPKIQHIAEIHPFIEHMKELNPYNLGWRFQFGKSREWAGLCSVHKDPAAGKSTEKNIYVSINFVRHDLNWKQNMTGVILHEIAHAIVRELFYYENGVLDLAKGDAKLHKVDDLDKPSEGHGLIWKQICGAINGSQCRIKLETTKMSEAFKPYKYDCSFCGHEGFGNNKRFTSECAKCHKSITIEGNTK